MAGPRARSLSLSQKATPIAGGSTASEPSRSYLNFTFVLTLLPLALAAFAFALHFRSGSDDPRALALLMGDDGQSLPGWQRRPSNDAPVPSVSASTAGCATKAPYPYPLFPMQPWRASMDALPVPKICITTTTSAGLSQILPWMFYHQTIGVRSFILFVEGTAAKEETTAVLQNIPNVRIVYRTKTLEAEQARSRIWNETWLSYFFFKPCNYELFVKQALNMEMAIKMAQEARHDWIAHVDTDELLYPAGAKDFSLQHLLLDLPHDVDMAVFPNYESIVESESIKDPFTEITLFKRNYDHMAESIYFGHYKEATRDNPNYFLTYGNGKSVARVIPGLRPNGAHRWHNYFKTPNEVKFPEAAILHYTYAKFSDLTSRRDRCSCKPNKEDVKRCFMLEFDRNAFIVASTQTEDQMKQWYREHVAWMDSKLKGKLIKTGMFGRLITPQVIIQGIYSSGLINETIGNGAGHSSQASIQKQEQQEGAAHSSPGEGDRAASLGAREETGAAISMPQGTSETSGGSRTSQSGSAGTTATTGGINHKFAAKGSAGKVRSKRARGGGGARRKGKSRGGGAAKATGRGVAAGRALQWVVEEEGPVAKQDSTATEFEEAHLLVGGRALLSLFTEEGGGGVGGPGGLASRVAVPPLTLPDPGLET